MTFAVGDALPPFRIASVSTEGMKTWAKVLHDPNPIHLDVEVVKARGLGDRVINQGPANVAYVMNMLTAAFPGATLESIDSRFVDNVFGGEAVEAGGAITGVTREGDQDKIACEVWLKAGERTVITGTAVIAAPKA